VSDEEEKLLRELLRGVSCGHEAADGWCTVCVAVFGSADDALYRPGARRTSSIGLPDLNALPSRTAP
jgi:hypothetical protein